MPKVMLERTREGKVSGLTNSSRGYAKGKSSFPRANPLAAIREGYSMFTRIHRLFFPHGPGLRDLEPATFRRTLWCELHV
jgi:hypothetical protein